MRDTGTPPNLSPPEDGETPVNLEDAGYTDLGDLVSKIRRCYDEGVGAWEENRRMHSEDLNFVYNSEAQGQWDPVVLEARKGKPCYTFNRVIGPVNIVVADMRQTRPAGKVRPTNASASEATADVLGGLVRSIEDESRADPIYKHQYKFAVAGGFGAWRLTPEWADEDSFDQVLRIKDIPNPQTVIWDPEGSDACGGDAMWCIVGERISKEKFRSLYPEAAEDPVSFHISRDSYGWFTDKEVRLVEYMERIPFKKKLALMSDGTTEPYTDALKSVDKEFEEAGLKHPQVKRIVRTREVMKWRVMWVKCDGDKVLEGPIFYDWKRIPVVRVPGRYINIEGRKKFQSLVRHSKDAQRTYNSRMNDMIERSALIPKAPYLATEMMIKGYENEWAQANVASRPYLPYNVDKNAEGSGGLPQRMPPIDMPQAALELAQAAAQDIQATTGYFDPALGNADDMNRVSGKALVQHTRRSDLGSFEFIDGFGDALQLTWEMAIDMIPTIYDTERVIRIVGVDGVEKMVGINGAQNPSGQAVMHDLKVGSYACKVTIGPSFQTARQETLDALINFAEAVPSAAQVIPDLIAKNLDTPDADELARRLRIPLIHAGIIQPTEQEKSQIPPPPPPDPLQQAELQREQALAQRDAAQAQITQHKATMIPLEQERMVYETAGKHLANIKTASEFGDAAQAAQAEQEAHMQEMAHNQVSAMQDLTHNAQQQQVDLGTQLAQHQQTMQQGDQSHAMDLATQMQTHQQTLRHTEETHKHTMSQAKQTGEQQVEHTKKSNKQNLKHREEMHKAKVAVTKKGPATPPKK